jgi:hypothetical protein
MGVNGLAIVYLFPAIGESSRSSRNWRGIVSRNWRELNFLPQLARASFPQLARAQYNFLPQLARANFPQLARARSSRNWRELVSRSWRAGGLRVTVAHNLWRRDLVRRVDRPFSVPKWPVARS